MVSTVLHLDKSTQTDESYFDRTKISQNQSDLISSSSLPSSSTVATATANAKLDISSPEIKIEKVIRQRWQRTQRGGEHSVSSQTLSPIHGMYYLSRYSK